MPDSDDEATGFDPAIAEDPHADPDDAEGIVVNGAEVDRRKRRLLDEYGEDTPVETERLETDAEDVAGWAEYAVDGYLGGGYAWLVRSPAEMPAPSESMPEGSAAERDRVLLVLSRAGDGAWGIPGGGREAGETFEAAARREVREEAGVDCSVSDVLLINELVAATADGETVETPAGATREVRMLQVFFEGVYEGGSIAVQEPEMYAAGWFADPPAETTLHEKTETLFDRWDR